MVSKWRECWDTVVNKRIKWRKGGDRVGTVREV